MTDRPSRRTVLATLVIGSLAAMMIPGASLAWDTYPSTNATNRDNGLPHVDQISVGIGHVTLAFVNDTNSLAFFEYRIDGAELSSGTPHPNPFLDDVIYPGVGVDSRDIPTPVIVEETFTATQKVEVRLALGGERDWDFDWTTFEVLPDAQTKADCKRGGWADYGFKNQGQCNRFVNTGKDSR